MTQPGKIAITHANSLLAEELIKQIAESGVQPDSVVLLDISDQAGNRLCFADTYINVLDQHDYDYEGLTGVFLLQADEELEDLLQHADCYVVSHYAEENTTPEFFGCRENSLSFPEKPCTLKLAGVEQSTLLNLLCPLLNDIELTSLQVVNVQSAAIYGKPGVEELASQTIDLLNGREVSASIFPMQLAFNMIPQEIPFQQAAGYRHILGIQQLSCSVQNILVPAFHGLSISVVLESTQEIDRAAVKEKLAKIPAVGLSEDLVSPFTHCNSAKKILIFGLDQPQNDSNRLQFWVIADSVKNGLVNNYLNVMEFLLNSHL